MANQNELNSTSSEQAIFATLTPVNAVAKAAFHRVVEASALEQKHCFHKQLMQVKHHREYDVETARALYRALDDESDSGTPTELDTDTEREFAGVASTWAGQYVFNLGIMPSHAGLGWVAGKGRRDDPSAGYEVEFLLSTRSARHEGIRGRHASFNFSRTTGFFGVTRASGAWMELTVDGEQVLRKHFAFNKSEANVRIGLLEYRFRYTQHSRSLAFLAGKKLYLEEELLIQSLPPPYLDPTPAPESVTVGPWTICSSLGRGGSGRVHAAISTQNEVVAIKTLERKSKQDDAAIQAEVRVLKALTDLASVEDSSERLLRLRHVYYQHGKEEYDSREFENVYMVLEPVANETLTRMIPKPPRLKMRNESMDLFREALLGVEFLHSHGWLHRDLKPANIGVLCRDPPRIVLLDLGGAIHAGSTPVDPTPGCGGTVGYLAPERELQPYDCSVDVWAMGIIGYELLHGRHPWPLARNPWRQENLAQLRPHFESMYDREISRLAGKETVSFHNMLAQMLRHQWTSQDVGSRISLKEALSHPCWQARYDDGTPAAKKTKT